MKASLSVILLFTSGLLASPVPEAASSVTSTKSTPPRPLTLPTPAVLPAGPDGGETPVDPFIPPQKCPKKNQVFVECGTACPARCFQPPPTICTLQCVIGCQCAPGFFLNKVCQYQACPLQDCGILTWLKAGSCVTALGCVWDIFNKSS
ncbi:unnamed protein product [Clonostachys solani]|uniref:TIL domain-containing protein n=1 Tax=Clonostachys solani TaxID=160281 RepID=A0A9N9YY52_9HYPO|nr:unnamed protein product [Clonostachys solani]